jgi:hypothetical protein
METKEIIEGKADYERYLTFIEMPQELQRFNFYRGKIYPIYMVQKKETDTHVYWSSSEKKPRFENDRLFYTHKNRTGATWDKEKKTLKIWFGHTPSTLSTTILKDIILHFKIDWYNDLSESLKTLLNKTILQNMIKGKITNPRDFVKAYLKTSPYKKMDISPELFYKTFSDTDRFHASPKFFRKVLEFSTNVNHALELLTRQNGNLDSYILDIYEQAAALNRKVNPRWSRARMNEVHTKWTRKIMAIEIKSLKAVDYGYPEFTTPKGIEIISNNYELFEEGTVMKHCVYTNYESRIRRREYFAFRYNRDGVRATIGATSDGEGNIKLNQMYSIGNTAVSSEHKQYVIDWLQDEHTQFWLQREYTKKTISSDQLVGWL